ncbi:MAG TPA: cyclic 2,3-diphosphoglycerate synthase [Alphaproteobacteria bacterium]|nr:cyclic 2,3-diphosphoglycerate synthase [Alphaproteobacteria bacterium]
MKRRRVIIMGAAGRDFHNFNMVFRDDERYEVMAFTAAQIPHIAGRQYPASLAGRLYPKGIPILPETQLCELIRQHRIDEVIFSYSDVSFDDVMTKASQVNAAGADFAMLGTEHTMLQSQVPVVAVVAVRTGAGKSQTARKVCGILHALGRRVVAIRHPMPYGDLTAQRVQRFATLDDLAKHKCTIEEMEEYEPHLASGTVVYAGVDYEAIIRLAEREADIVVWDGGNNDLPFYRPDLLITLTDPHRPGHELSYYPGATNVRLADVVVINKVESARREQIEVVRRNVREVNPGALIIEAASPITVEDDALVHGQRVLVVEDGPTVTHGEMSYGAGTLAARKFGAKALVDPRPWLVGSLVETFRQYPQIGAFLPAMGYSADQVKDLESTINQVDCDTVVIGTPIDLRRVLTLNKPSTRVRYELAEVTKPDLSEVLTRFIRQGTMTHGR